MIEKHDASEKYQLAMEAEQVSKAPEKAPIVRSIAHLTTQQNEQMLLLFRTVFCLVKHNLSLNFFPVLLNLQQCNGLPIGPAYNNRKAASTFIDAIVAVHQQSLIDSLNGSDFFLSYLMDLQMYQHLSNKLSMVECSLMENHKMFFGND